MSSPQRRPRREGRSRRDQERTDRGDDHGRRRETTYHSDRYGRRDAPRAYESVEAERPVDYYAQQPTDVESYEDLNTNVTTELDNLSIGSENTRPNYTTDRAYISPPQSSAATRSVTYPISSAPAGSIYSTIQYSTSPQAQPAAYTTFSTSPPLASSTYSTNAYATSPQPVSSTNLASTYSTYPQAAGSRYSTSAYSGSPQSPDPATTYSQTRSGYGTSYDYDPRNPVQQSLSEYNSGGSAATTTYNTSPSYVQQGGAYASPQFSPTEENQIQGTSDLPRSSTYTVESEAQNPILPVPIAQCGCLGCDRDNLPKLRDGKEGKKYSLKSESSRDKHSRDKHSTRSKSSSVSTSASFHVQGASGSNCGALYLSDIKPRPKPQRRHDKDEDEYEAELHRWKSDWKQWRDTSCPCRYGYFGEDDAMWVSGSHVRQWLKDGRGNPRPGAKRGNPRWERNEWKAPEQPKPGGNG